MHRITINTGARLHFGLITPHESAERRFGGVGVMLGQPGFEVHIEPDVVTSVHAPEGIAERVETFVDRWNQLTGTTSARQPFRISIVQHIPSHGGMGSGTQLALAIGKGLAEFQNVDPGLAEIATAMQRGRRSAIGIHGFQQGGFIVDAGKSAEQQVGHLGIRTEWPSEWPIVLLTLQQSAGLSGEAELAAFKDLGPMSDDLVSELGSTIDSGLLPSIRTKDFEQFCQSLDQYGDLVGDYFAPAQGGRYADRRMRKIVSDLRAANVGGIAQSSWGPTVCVVCCDRCQAENLVKSIQETDFEGEVKIVAGLNQGASIRRTKVSSINV